LHHDIVFNITTAVRLHLIEIILSMLYKTPLVIVLGAKRLTVIVFEFILNGCQPKS